MKKNKIRIWFYYNIIIPGLGIFGADDNSTDPCVTTCHLPGLTPPFGTPLHQSPLLIIIIISIGILAAFGGVLLYRYISRRETLKDQYKKRIISKEEYIKMKG